MNERRRWESFGDFLWDFTKDIFVPLLVGSCTVLLAFYANQIAESANETARLQALIAKNAEAPTIEVAYMPGGYESDASIAISILDGKYHNFTSETASFLSFAFHEYDENGEWMSYSIDLPIDYYLMGGGPQILYGEIWKWHSSDTAEIKQLSDRYKEYYVDAHSSELYWSPPGISVTTCLKCTYLDLLEEEETVYYIVGLNVRTSQISRESGEAWFQKRDDMLKNHLLLYSNTVEETDVEAVSRLIDTIKAEAPQYIITDDANS